MNYIDPSICGWSPAPYILFSENIWGNFIYYSHLLPSLTGLVISSVILLNSRSNRASWWLFAMTASFAIWCVIDLAVWASDRSDVIMFTWSSLIFFELAVYTCASYFVYSFINKKNPPWPFDAVIFLLYVPLLLFGHTHLNLYAFDFTNCWREALEGPLWQSYIYNVELAISLLILGYGSYKMHKEHNRTKRKEIGYITVGVIAFLASFSFGNIVGSFVTDWEIGQYGLFGMPVFVALLAYLMVKFHTFNVKVVASEVLISGVVMLIGSLLFIRRAENVKIVALFTLVITISMGALLIRSVRREVQQREHIEELAKNLARANQRLKQLDKLKNEFVSVASHQMRSPLTAIRGYASMILEGSYGPIPPKMREPLERISDSSAFMASSVEDYLSVSRIESGNMRYNNTDFNLGTEVEKVVDDLRRSAIKNGLVLTSKNELSKNDMVRADLGKTQQIIHNLITNAIKYTQRGSITAYVHDDPKRKEVYMDIIDTGIGMKEETILNLFGKFTRAENAHTVNVNGTGLGLYIAREMARKMGGDITASSPGEGKGSIFRLTFKLQL